VDAFLCHEQDTCKTVHTRARSKMPQYNIVNDMSSYFPMTGFKATVYPSTGNNRQNYAPTRWYVHQQDTIDTSSMPLPDGVFKDEPLN